MELRQLGRSGLAVSTVGLGCNNFGMRIGPDESAAVVHASLDAGITFFDTAEIYGDGASEQFLGDALAGRRDEVVVATKFGAQRKAGPEGTPGSRRNIVRACEKSLRRLGTDRIDLYYQHVPDRLTPVEETLGALTDLVRQGKVRYIASSNVAGWQLADADHVARSQHLERFVACQMEWSLLRRDIEREIVPACQQFGLGVIAYFPIASGLLTGKYRRGEAFPPDTRLGAIPRFASIATDETFDRIERLTAVAEQRDHPLLDLALSWLLAQDACSSVLVGATRPEQVAQNAAAATWAMSADDLAAVAALD